MDAPESTRRRWWHSTEWNVLLVLTIVIAIGLGYVGWQAYVVHHRWAMREQIKAGGGTISRGSPDSDHYYIRERSPYYIVRQGNWADPPKVRLLLGDEIVRSIEFPRRLTAADYQAIEDFPDAWVVIFTGPRRTGGCFH